MNLNNSDNSNNINNFNNSNKMKRNSNQQNQTQQKEIEQIEINDESEFDWLSAMLDKPTFRASRRSIQKERKTNNKSPEVEIVETVKQSMTNENSKKEAQYL